MVGFATKAGGRATTQAVTQVIDNSGGKDTAAAAWLAAYFGVSVTTEPAPTAAADDSTGNAGGRRCAGGVTVILGSAEEQSFLGDPGIRSLAPHKGRRRVGQRIAVLTGGGDAPGLNAAIRAIGRRAIAAGDTLFGIRNGWAGLIGDGRRLHPGASQALGDPAARRHDARQLARQPDEDRWWCRRGAAQSASVCARRAGRHRWR